MSPVSVPSRLRPPARWVLAPPASSDLVGQLATELLLPTPVCQLLVGRGIRDVASAKQYLRPRLESLVGTAPLFDLDRAVERIATAVQNNETIVVHGDYDVDGMTSTALLTRVLRGCGARNVVPFVPNRLTDGYDLSAAGVQVAVQAGASLVITCDCGTSAIEAAQSLADAGIDLIITDHHLPGGPLPTAYAVCNPRRKESAQSDQDLAAVGVVYKIALALCEAMGVSLSLVHRQLDLVALGTIADVAPLRGENRILVRYGLKLLAETTHPGLHALLRSSGLDGKPLTSGRVGFVLAPRLNAAGRIGDANLGLQLLLSERADEANRIARELEELNRARQELDRAVLDQAMRQLDAPGMADKYAFVLSQEGWHAGVIGIVASRIVEQTARPAVLIAVGDGIGKGSGRSISPFDLHAALSTCSPHFQRFGGHRAAAGLTMDAAKIPAFAEQFDAVAKAVLTADDLVPELRVDMELPLLAIDDAFEKLIRHFEPFGMGNPAPVFQTIGSQMAEPPRRIGTDGIRLTIAGEQGPMSAIGWGMAERAKVLEIARPLDLVFRIERDEYRGASRLQLKLADFRSG